MMAIKHQSTQGITGNMWSGAEQQMNSPHPCLTGAVPGFSKCLWCENGELSGVLIFSLDSIST